MGPVQIEPQHDSEPLSGARLKLARAAENLETVRETVQAFLARDPYTYAQRRHTEGRGFTLTVTATEQPPARIGVLIGEFAFNVRSALDHAIYELSVWRSRTRTDNAKLRGALRTCQYPIFSTADEYPQRAAPMTSLLSDDDRAVIQSQQPFNNGGPTIRSHTSMR